MVYFTNQDGGTGMSLDELKEQLDRIERASIIAAKRILNIEEVAYLTGFKKNTIYEMTSKGLIPHSKQAGRLFFSKDEIESWLMSNRTATQQELESKAATYIATHR